MLLRNLLVPILFMTIILLSTTVKAHDGYPAACCSDNDCKPVSCQDLEETKDGGWSYDQFKFRKDQVKQFQGKTGCHVCITSGGTPICVMPPFGT